MCVDQAPWVDDTPARLKLGLLADDGHCLLAKAAANAVDDSVRFGLAGDALWRWPVGHDSAFNIARRDG